LVARRKRTITANSTACGAKTTTIIVGTGGLAAARSRLGSDSRLRLSFTTSAPLRYLDGPFHEIFCNTNRLWSRTVEDAGPYKRRTLTASATKPIPTTKRANTVRPYGGRRCAQTRRAGACSRRKRTITANGTACSKRTVRTKGSLREGALHRTTAPHLQPNQSRQPNGRTLFAPTVDERLAQT